jgi:hypothetical protein
MNINIFASDTMSFVYKALVCAVGRVAESNGQSQRGRQDVCRALLFYRGSSGRRSIIVCVLASLETARRVSKGIQVEYVQANAPETGQPCGQIPVAPCAILSHADLWPPC